MTQLQFADTFLFPISTLRNWEQGSREPDGSARVLLKLIENDPDYIKQEIEQIQAVA
jgi:putative transcriptional regulator